MIMSRCEEAAVRHTHSSIPVIGVGVFSDNSCIATLEVLHFGRHDGHRTVGLETAISDAGAIGRGFGTLVVVRGANLAGGGTLDVRGSSRSAHCGGRIRSSRGGLQQMAIRVVRRGRSLLKLVIRSFVNGVGVVRHVGGLERVRDGEKRFLCRYTMATARSDVCRRRECGAQAEE